MNTEVLYPEFLSVRREPENLSETDRHMFIHEFGKTIHATELLRYRNVQFSYDGLLLKNYILRRECLKSEPVFRALRFRHGLRLIMRYKRVAAKPGKPYLAVHNYDWQGYFHWMTECLTRLYAVRHLLDECRLLLPRPRTAFHQKTIEAFGAADIQFLDEKQYMHVPELWMPSYTAPPGNYNPAYLRGVADTLLRHFKSVPDRGIGKLYISRSKARWRKITNEADVERLVHAYGFTSVCMEDLSYEEQVASVRSAKQIISLHGGGLTNMMFMQPRSAVLEIRHAGDPQINCYFTMASELGHRYFYLISPQTDPEESSHTADVLVDLGKLEAILQEMSADAP